jgi:hypothetical protein
VAELRLCEGKVLAVVDSVEILKEELIGLDSVVKTLKACVQNHDAALSKVNTRVSFDTASCPTQIELPVPKLRAA